MTAKQEASQRKDKPLSMIGYWVDKKGLEIGLTEYYPELSASDPVINSALLQIKLAKAAVFHRLGQIQAELDE